MQGRFKVRLFIENKHLSFSKQSKTRGCENPEALSSITILEDGAAMKIIKKQKSLHSRRKTEKAINV